MQTYESSGVYRGIRYFDWTFWDALRRVSGADVGTGRMRWVGEKTFVLSHTYRSPDGLSVFHISDGLVARELERREDLGRKFFEVNGCGRCLAVVQRLDGDEKDDQ
jgi:hypothetical protein